MSAPVHLKSNRYGAGDAQLYETPHAATCAMIKADPWLQQRGRTILEPCCGPGQMVQVLQDVGHTVIASDLHDYSDRWKGAVHPKPVFGMNVFDYSPNGLRLRVTHPDEYALMTNPPYGAGEPGETNLAASIATHALELAPRVYLLLELPFQVGGRGCKLRDRLMDSQQLTGVFPFRERLDMHRDGFPDEDKQAQTRMHAWYRWERTPSQPREHRRLTTLNGGDVCDWYDERRLQCVGVG